MIPYGSSNKLIVYLYIVSDGLFSVRSGMVCKVGTEASPFPRSPCEAFGEAWRQCPEAWRPIELLEEGLVL